MSGNCGKQPEQTAETDIESYRRRGDRYHGCGRYEEAINEYGQVIRLLPDDAGAYCGRADCYLRLTQYREAIADFERAVELDSYSALARFENTLSFSDWNPFRRVYMGRAMSDPYYWVIDFLQQSLFFEPGSIQAHVQLGDTYEWFSQTHLWDECDENPAQSHYDEALASPPTDSIDYHYRGEAYSRKGDSDSALSCYSTAIDMDPGYAPAYKDRAMLHMGEARHESAAADWSNAVRVDPNNPSYSYQRGMSRIALAIRPVRGAISAERWNWDMTTPA